MLPRCLPAHWCVAATPGLLGATVEQGGDKSECVCVCVCACVCVCVGIRNTVADACCAFVWCICVSLCVWVCVCVVVVLWCVCVYLCLGLCVCVCVFPYEKKAAEL